MGLNFGSLRVHVCGRGKKKNTFGKPENWRIGFEIGWKKSITRKKSM
jgi:hypothetical protein